jgi:hypothetical protein
VFDNKNAIDKIMRQTLFALILMLLPVSCGPQNNINELPAIDVIGNLGTYRQIPMSELISGVEYIPLETMPNSLMHQSNYLTVTSSHIFVASTTYCYVFSREGKFISSIGTRGRGPGEFIIITGISVDEENRIIYLDSSNGILKYAWNGKFERSIKRPVIHKGEYDSVAVKSVSFLRNNLFLGHVDNNSGKESLSWAIFDETSTIVKTFDNHFKLEKEGFFSSSFGSSKAIKVSGNVYVKMPLNDTLYCIDQYHELNPAFVFDLGRYSFPVDKLVTSTYMQELLFNSVSIDGHVLFPLVISQSNIFFWATVGKNAGINTPPILQRGIISRGYEAEYVSTSLAGFYNIDSGKTEFLDSDPVSRRMGFINDIDGGLSFWPKHYNESNNELVGIWDAYQMKKLLTEDYFAAHPAKDPVAHERLRALLKNLKETDNPVIVTAKLKK